MKILYKGFSTHNYTSLGGTFSVTDIDLVNLDILSHIYTERNERVMMPGWGTDIPNKPFEPLTNDLIEDVYDEIIRVVDYDPRVERIRVTVVPYIDANALVCSATLRYIELNDTDSFDFVLNLETGN